MKARYGFLISCLSIVSQQRSIKSRFSEETILSASNTLEIIFPEGRTRKAAIVFVNWLKRNNGQASKNAVSEFADLLEGNSLSLNGSSFKYSRRNFYMTVLRTLVDLGFVRKNVPVWDEARRKTLYMYTRNIFDIPQRPPSIGFWRHAYYICKKWNEMFTDYKSPNL